MRPRVFLSHSKKDEVLIKRLAIDLRIARIDAWYDDWEIPVGASLRAKIFEEGIKDCDLFFAYLSASAVASEWCRRELDAAFVLDFSHRGGFLALFVDSDQTRSSVALDIQALRVPVLSDSTYHAALLETSALAWEAAAKKRERLNESEAHTRVTELRLAIAEKDREIERLRTVGLLDEQQILTKLREKTYQFQNGHALNLAEIFVALANDLAAGAWDYRIAMRVVRLAGLSDDRHATDVLHAASQYEVSDFIGPIVILGLATIRPPEGDYKQLYFVTDAGKRLLAVLGVG
jgi:TIR domain